MDRIKEQLDQLTELGDDQVTELRSEIVSEFESVEKLELTPQSVDAMTSLADMLDSVQTEMKRREAVAQELALRATEAASRVYGKDVKEDDMETAMNDDEDKKEKSSDEAAIHDGEDKKEMPSEEAPAVSPDMEEEKMKEAPMANDIPNPMDEEEDKKEEDKKSMSTTEASIEADKTVELSTETEKNSEAAPAAEETIVAAAEETLTTEVPTEATPETPAEFAAEQPVEAEASSAEATAVVEAAPEAEAAIQEAITTESTEPSVQETMEAPVTAAANNAENLDIEVPADRRPTSRTTAAPVAITAGADIPGYTAGSSLSDMNAVAEAMAKRLHGLRRVNGGDGEQHIVASITTSFSEDRQLTQDAESNWAKVQSVVGPEALVASGGHSAPFEVRYDIFGMGTNDRPLRDALPRFQADRGGIRYIVPPVLSSYDNAVGVWTNAVDTNPGTDVKASLTVSAATETTVATDAVTLQLQFGNLMTRAYPELIARHNELGLIQHAREAEQYLLTKMSDASTAITSTSLIGFGRDYLVQVGRAAAAYRSRNRLAVDMPLRVIAPSWVKDAMAADLAISAPGDNSLNSYAEIDGYLASRGVNITYTPDQNVFPAASAGAMAEFPDSFVWYIFAEGTFLFLDGGTLDLGIIRDSTLVGTNDYKMFVETFEGLAKVGTESIKVTSAINVNGVAAALRDTTGGATAAAIEY